MQIESLVERVRGLSRERDRSRLLSSRLLPSQPGGLRPSGSRVMIGIAGEPGSGKSSLAEALAAKLGDAVVAPMDGFHLANRELERLGRLDRKGAIDTFDAEGYLALLDRLRGGDEGREPAVVYAPCYERGVEESIGSAIPILPSIPVVISEGNYLLAESDPWPAIRSRFDEVWFVETPPEKRLEWLVARHVASGKSPEAAEAWATGPDEVNARLIRETRGLADLVVSTDEL